MVSSPVDRGLLLTRQHPIDVELLATVVILVDRRGADTPLGDACDADVATAPVDDDRTDSRHLAPSRLIIGRSNQLSWVVVFKISGES